MATRRQIYAVYRGEENLGDGTAEELAKKLNVSEKMVEHNWTLVWGSDNICIKEKKKFGWKNLA